MRRLIGKSFKEVCVLSIPFKIARGKSADLPVLHRDGYAYFTTDTGKFYIDAKINDEVKRFCINPNADWAAIQGGAMIENKPSLPNFYYNTKSYWDSYGNGVSELGAFYIYSDYIKEGAIYIPGIKIGDGKAYISDLPFIDMLYLDHINNNDIHVTSEEKEFWNNKVRAYCSQVEDETIVFTTE